jgi:hypothetical protein
VNIGVNLPWSTYHYPGSIAAGRPIGEQNVIASGWDFGDIPGWGIQTGRPDAPPVDPRFPLPPNRPYLRPWHYQLGRQLDEFKSLGINVVRWWMLGGGHSYGTLGDRPQQSRTGGNFQFEPPPLSAVPTILSDFLWALEIFQRIGGIQIMPVLMDFPIVAEPRPGPLNPSAVGGGRSQLVTDPTKRASFINNFLTPLLNEINRLGYRDQIYAWDVMNEPDSLSLPMANNVGHTNLTEFLHLCSTAIDQAHHRCTVGFANYNRLVSWTQGARTFGSPLITHFRQFHYYGDPYHCPGVEVANATSAVGGPLIIGEMATSPFTTKIRPSLNDLFDMRVTRPETANWPTPLSVLARQATLPQVRLYRRLQYLQDVLHYDQVFLWAADGLPDVLRNEENRNVVLWTAATKADVRNFTAGLGPSPPIFDARQPVIT